MIIKNGVTYGELDGMIIPHYGNELLPGAKEFIQKVSEKNKLKSRQTFLKLKVLND